MGEQVSNSRKASEEPAILLVDHGSRRSAANEQLEEVARLIRARDPGRIVRVAHMEIAPPTLADGIAECVAAGATEIVVHPYLLAPGRHSQEDIPAQAAAAAAGHAGVRVRVSQPLGLHEKIVDVVLERVAETKGDDTR
jgi:sirohydrochlorin ferrochelatase